MREWEVVETESFVVVALQLLIHALFGDSLHDIFTVLLLHRDLLLRLDLLQLVQLLADSDVLKALLLQVLHFLLGSGLCPGLSLLHVLFQVLPRVLVRSFVEEECSLTSIELFIQERLEGHLRQELIVSQRI